eukprot:Hpha_TRINITY_DN31594_c0_g1::TRINITY_DN31594_c0_g1_i1::g.1595::m.1595
MHSVFGEPSPAVQVEGEKGWLGQDCPTAAPAGPSATGIDCDNQVPEPEAMYGDCEERNTEDPPPPGLGPLPRQPRARATKRVERSVTVDTIPTKLELAAVGVTTGRTSLAASPPTHIPPQKLLQVSLTERRSRSLSTAKAPRVALPLQMSSIRWEGLRDLA